MESPPPEPLGRPPAQCQRGLHLLRVSRDGSRLRPTGRGCSTAAAPLRLLHPTPRPAPARGHSRASTWRDDSCPRLWAPAPRLSSVPFPARLGTDTSLGDRRGAEPGRAGAGAAAAAPLRSSPLPRAAGELAGEDWGRRNESTASPYFSPAPLFLSRHFRTIPPTRSLLPPPLVAGAGLSPSPCLRLPRPFPAPPSPLGARRRAGPQRSANPAEECVYLHASPHPIPGCLQQPGVLVLCRGGKERWLSLAVAFCKCFPASPRESVCVCARGNLCNHGFPQKGEGVGERSASSVLSPSRRSPLIP